MQSIQNDTTARRPLNFNEAVRAVGVQTMMSVGWQPKTVVRAGSWFKVKVSRKYWLTIKLNSLDLYDVEVGSVRKKNGLPEYKVIEQQLNVFAEDLSKTVLTMGDRA